MDRVRGVVRGGCLRNLETIWAALRNIVFFNIAAGCRIPRLRYTAARQAGGVSCTGLTEINGEYCRLILLAALCFILFDGKELNRLRRAQPACRLFPLFTVIYRFTLRGRQAFALRLYIAFFSPCRRHRSSGISWAVRNPVRRDTYLPFRAPLQNRRLSETP